MERQCSLHLVLGKGHFGLRSPKHTILNVHCLKHEFSPRWRRPTYDLTLMGALMPCVTEFS